jgi:lysophosphatidic acid acyltransferase/lysophosphatidylinositol acyltransferase
VAEVVFLASGWAGVRLRFFGDKKAFDNFGKLRAIALCNHGSDIDWLLGWVAAQKVGVIGVCLCWCVWMSGWVCLGVSFYVCIGRLYADLISLTCSTRAAC